MKYIVIFLLPIWQCIAQVTVPNHDLHWKFDYNNLSIDHTIIAYDGLDSAINAIRSRVSEIELANFVSNRNGDPIEAVKMGAGSTIDFSYNNQKFYGLSPLTDTASNMDAFTISFWVKFDEETTNERLLFGAKESSSGTVKFGLALKGKTLYLKRYYEHEDGTIGVPWDYECFAPAAFDAGTGWYYVCAIFAKTQKYMRLFLGKPNGGAKYGPGTAANVPGTNIVTREFDGRLIWIPGIRDGLSSFQYWYMGDAEGLTFDELKLWNRDLTLDQVALLFNSEKNGSGNKVDTSKTKPIATPEELVSEINIYPNPNHGKFTLKFSMINQGKVGYSLYSLDGRQVLSNKDQVFGSGTHVLQIDASHLASGMYFLNVNSLENPIKGHKIIIE